VTLTERIDELLGPYEAALTLLVTIPGVARRSAQVILAEIGADMSRFPTAGHLASWAGM
jgi:transposase